MKRLVCGIVLVCLVLGLTGCKDNSLNSIDLDLEKALYEITFNVDSSWDYKSFNDGYIFYPFNNEEKGFFIIQSQNLLQRMSKEKLTQEDIKDNVYNFVGGWIKGNTIVYSFDKYDNEFPTAKISGNAEIDGRDYRFISNVFLTSSKLYSFSIVQRGEIDSSFREAVKEVTKSILLEETILYENFDKYAYNIFSTGEFCNILSREIKQSENGNYFWNISIDSVSDFDSLMLNASIIGTAVNPSIQQSMLEDGAVIIDFVGIDINGGQAYLLLMPPVGSAVLFTSNIVIRDEFEGAEQLQASYNKYMAQSDFLDSMLGS